MVGQRKGQRADNALNKGFARATGDVLAIHRQRRHAQAQGIHLQRNTPGGGEVGCGWVEFVEGDDCNFPQVGRIMNGWPTGSSPTRSPAGHVLVAPTCGNSTARVRDDLQLVSIRILDALRFRARVAPKTVPPVHGDCACTPTARPAHKRRCLLRKTSRSEPNHELLWPEELSAGPEEARASVPSSSRVRRWRRSRAQDVPQAARTRSGRSALRAAAAQSCAARVLPDCGGSIALWCSADHERGPVRPQIDIQHNRPARTALRRADASTPAKQVVPARPVAGTPTSSTAHRKVTPSHRRRRRWCRS